MSNRLANTNENDYHLYQLITKTNETQLTAKTLVKRMLTIKHSTSLLAPLAYRSEPGTPARLRGFSDRAAEAVLRKIESLTHSNKRFYRGGSDREEHIDRCIWIDQQLLYFFSMYPDASGVEVHGGISTRFHRLSEQMEWPIFSWVSVNSKELTRYLKQIFPKLDNFQYIECEPKNWQYISDANVRSGRRKIFILGDASPITKPEEIIDFIKAVSQHFDGEAFDIDLIISHTLKSFPTQSVGVSCDTIAHYESRGLLRTGLSKLCSRLSFLSHARLRTVHLRLSITKNES